MKKLILLIVAVVVASGCDIAITGPTIDNTNTNTNSNTIDVHDIGSFQPTPSPTTPVSMPNGGTEIPLNIPSNSKTLAEQYAANNSVALLKSCQTTNGESAWIFMDGLVLILKSSDPRWGYLIKTDGTTSHDVIAYRATSDNVGAWGVDVIIDHCGSPKFGWNVIGFDASAVWSASRK